MDRAWKSGARATPPVAPVSPSMGYPTSGDAGLGVPATVPGDWWHYMMTEELRNIVVAGGLTPDHTQVNQVLEALEVIFGGRLLNVRVFTTANNGQSYAETAGTKSIIAIGCGASGGSGACAATGAGQGSFGQSTGSGAFGIGRYTAAFSGALITVGQAGTAGVAGGANGGTGGTTSLGALISLPGSVGGTNAGVVSTSTATSYAGAAGASAPAGANIIARAGNRAVDGIAVGSGPCFIGDGADSPFGYGARGSWGLFGAGVSGSGYGAGSRGAYNAGGFSLPAANGAVGTPGIMLVLEFA